MDGLERSEPSFDNEKQPPPAPVAYTHSLPQPGVETGAGTAGPRPRHRQRLAVLRALPAPDDSQRRLKRVVQYVHGANALRNRFVQDLTDKVRVVGLVHILGVTFYQKGTKIA